MTTTVTASLIPIKIPQKKLAALCRQYHIHKLALFGSVLGKDFKPESDLDILVEFEPETRIGLMAFAKTQRELSELFQRPVDLVTPEGLKPLIKENILSQAQVIYAA